MVHPLVFKKHRNEGDVRYLYSGNISENGCRAMVRGSDLRLFSGRKCQIRWVSKIVAFVEQLSAKFVNDSNNVHSRRHFEPELVL